MNYGTTNIIESKTLTVPYAWFVPQTTFSRTCSLPYHSLRIASFFPTRTYPRVRTRPTQIMKRTQLTTRYTIVLVHAAIRTRNVFSTSTLSPIPLKVLNVHDVKIARRVGAPKTFQVGNPTKAPARTAPPHLTLYRPTELIVSP